MAQTVFNIACSMPDIDNIGEIIGIMGYYYEYYDLRELEDKTKFQNLNILFINCRSPDPTSTAKKNIKDFVSQGGALYASCYAEKWISAMFPDYVDFHEEGKIEAGVEATIIDPELKIFLNTDKILLDYNTQWHGIRKIKKNTGFDAVHVYLTGTRKKQKNPEPLLISFPYNQGFVIFTTFHNSVQKGDLEIQLLQYLVLKPLLAKADQTSKTIMQTKKFTAANQVIGTLKMGQESQKYNYDQPTTKDLKFIVNWEGKATGKSYIYDPNGNLVKTETIHNTPCEIDIPQAQAGKWTYKLAITDAPMKNFPYSINIGSKNTSMPTKSQLGPSKTISPGSKISQTPPMTQQPKLILGMGLGSQNTNPVPSTSKTKLIQSTETTMPTSESPATKVIQCFLLYPYNLPLQAINLTIDQCFLFGSQLLPMDLVTKAKLSGDFFEISLIGPNIVKITDKSKIEIKVDHIQPGNYIPQPKSIPKNWPVTLELPILIQITPEISLQLL